MKDKKMEKRTICGKRRRLKDKEWKRKGDGKRRRWKEMEGDGRRWKEKEMERIRNEKKM